LSRERQPRCVPAAKQLLREARNAAAPNHPNICTVHEIGDAAGRAFIALEYVDGQRLSDRLQQSALPVDEAVRHGIEAADALAYAHGHGVIHRDLKAANAIVGPEQVRGGATDARTDIWALGVLLYQMASGAKPFVAATVPELFSSILRDEPAHLPAGVPADLRRDRAVPGKGSRQRYPHAQDVRAALETIRSGAPSPLFSLRHLLVRRPVLAAGTAIVAARRRARRVQRRSDPRAARWRRTAPRIADGVAAGKSLRRCPRRITLPTG
jgi:eukaryotic-like serine/threonine-protein kinase